ERYDRNRIAVRISDVECRAIGVQRKAFRTAAEPRLFRQTNIDAFDFTVVTRIDHRHAVGIRIDHIETRASSIPNHRRWMMTHGNIRNAWWSLAKIDPGYGA